MAFPTYLELVNDVLIRLRESEVSAVTDNNYSKLISKFVNDSKRQVEDAYNWNALNTAVTFSTVSGTSTYSVTGSGQRFRVDSVADNTNKYVLRNETTDNMDYFILTNPNTGKIQYYYFNGVDSNGDTKVTFYPTPDAVYSITFNIIKPTINLSGSSDTVSVPSEPIVLGALARAIAERGEDGGIASGEIYSLYKQSLGDAIALESSRYIENDSWTAP
jgi:hypothetical protein